MANTAYVNDEIRFDVRDPDWTDVYVHISVLNDAPIGVAGWHHKRYPASMSTLEIHQQMFKSDNDMPLMWEIKAPPEVMNSQAGALAHALLTWDMGMDPTQPGWSYWEGLRMLAEQVIGRREKISQKH